MLCYGVAKGYYAKQVTVRASVIDLLESLFVGVLKTEHRISFWEVTQFFII